MATTGASSMLGDTLALKSYHRAQRIGEGGCGGVSMVYDDDGAVFAMKNFEADENDESLAVETLRASTTPSPSARAMCPRHVVP